MIFNLEKPDIQTWVKSVIFEISNKNQRITIHLSKYFLDDVFQELNIDAFKFLDEFIIKHQQFHSFVHTFKKVITSSIYLFISFLTVFFIRNFLSLIENPLVYIPEYGILLIFFILIIANGIYNVNFKKYFFRELLIFKYKVELLKAYDTQPPDGISKEEIRDKAANSVGLIFIRCVKEFNKNMIVFRDFLERIKKLNEEEVTESVDNFLDDYRETGILFIFFNKFGKICLSFIGIGLSVFLFYLRNPNFDLVEDYIIVIACILFIFPFIIQILYFTYILLSYKLKNVRIRKPTREIYKKIIANDSFNL